MFATKKALKAASIIFLMLFATNAKASEFKLVPSISSGTKYDNALNKATEAAMIQSGAKHMLDQITSKAKTVSDSVIENGTPFTAKQVYFVAGTAYTLGVKKQFSSSYSDPFLSGVTNTISVGQKSVGYTWSVSF